jgi:hypothetical protein
VILLLCHDTQPLPVEAGTCFDGKKILGYSLCFLLIDGSIKNTLATTKEQ